MFEAEFETWWNDELHQTDADAEYVSQSLKKLCYKAYLVGRVDENVACQEECIDTLENEDKAAYKDYEDNHEDGWVDGCNECHWAIAARMNQLQ